MFNFVAEDKKAVRVPYFEDATREEGWQGYSTTKSIKSLQSEISEAIVRLGGIVSGFQKGVFQVENQSREGFRIHYALKSSSGELVAGRLDIAALPVKEKYNESRKDKSLRMALYMLRTALNGMWFMQQLSPGYAPLMPWMLADENKTISQLWSESPVMSRLIPPTTGDFSEDEIIDAQ